MDTTQPTRSVENHLLSDEDVEDYFLSKKWAWISTDHRLLKYRKTDSGHEELQDLSYDEITGISMTHHGRDTKYLIGAILAGVIGLPLLTEAPFVGFGVVLVAVLLAWMWRNSEESYFEFKGSGLIQQEPEKWRIAKSSVENETQVNDFVRSVREQL